MSICSIWRVNKEVEIVVKNGLWIMVGDGKNTLFWEDLWVGDSCLKDRFPRLYSLSSQRETFIAECGVWDGFSWNWNLIWRCQFFEWENTLLFDLQVIISLVLFGNSAILVDIQLNHSQH